ncbi:MAG TPA: 50S ribosomal protein L29 [Candidatus Norongarragalinales archaeon]|nr:50S ribosomal protein L29 [Candidatus Norongarragalinales archaeon]
MAITKKKDLKGLSAADLKAKIGQMELEIAAELSAMKSSGRPANAGRLRQAKRLKARILTLLTQKGEKTS